MYKHHKQISTEGNGVPMFREVQIFLWTKNGAYQHMASKENRPAEKRDGTKVLIYY